MSNPHPSPQAHAAAGRASRAASKARRDDRFEEVRHLMGFGVAADQIARQVGASRAAIERQAERWGAPDIRAYMAVSRQTKCPQCGTVRQTGRAGLCRACWYADRMTHGWRAAS